MKTIITSLALSLSLILSAQTDSNTKGSDTEGTTITVTVPVPSNDGSVIFALFDETNFMTPSPVQGLESEIKDGKAIVTFENVTPGIYAITLFHDKNGNKQMDFEPNGMPKEMYGVSNNVMSYGPPQWSDAKFEVANQPIEMEIRM